MNTTTTAGMTTATPETETSGLEKGSGEEESLGASGSTSTEPFSESDNSVSGVADVVPAGSAVVLSPAASALSLFSRASLQSIPVCSHHLWGDPFFLTGQIGRASCQEEGSSS